MFNKKLYIRNEIVSLKNQICPVFVSILIKQIEKLNKNIKKQCCFVKVNIKKIMSIVKYYIINLISVYIKNFNAAVKIFIWG